MADIEQDDPIDDKPMPLLEHLVELRRRLMWSIGAFLICFMVSYYFSSRIYYFLAEPLANVLREQGNPDPHLIYTQLYEAFFTRIKVAFFSGAFFAGAFFSAGGAFFAVAAFFAAGADFAFAIGASLRQA